MAIGYPPVPVFPLAIDSDYTLFLVYNTSEAKLTSDNSAWSDEVDVEPSAIEQWGENGFANIDGEMFYYDSVEKNGDGKIFKLKRCARNLGGTKTHHNKAGVWVRGFVVAEHHNQLATTIMLLEKYIGLHTSCDPCLDFDKETLDYKIRSLLCVNPIVEDSRCPNVFFSFEAVRPSSDACVPSAADLIEGTIVNFVVTITGSYTRYVLDFGDGSTTTDLSGTHNYPSNIIPEPTVTVSNDLCEIVVTPHDVPAPEPEPTPPPEFLIPVCNVPDFPPVIIPNIDTCTPLLTFPQIVFPCLDINIPSFTGISITIPSIIVVVGIPSMILFGPVNIPPFISIVGPFPPLPSIISIVGCQIPSVISIVGIQLPSVISIVGCQIPSVISIVGMQLPSVISIVGCQIPSVISIVGITIPNFITLSLSCCIPSVISLICCGPISLLRPDWGISLIQPNWAISVVGIPSVINCTVTIVCSTVAPAFAMTGLQSLGAGLNDNFLDDMNNAGSMPEVITQGLGIPSIITIAVPEIPAIRIDHDIPTRIQLTLDKIPPMKIEFPEEMPKIQIDVSDLPKTIGIDASEMPKSIFLDASAIPGAILLQVPENFPHQIQIDASSIPANIRVIGIPDSIELKGSLPSEIKLTLPEGLEVPLVYKGGPIPIKFDETMFQNADGEDAPCFAIIPCQKK